MSKRQYRRTTSHSPEAWVMLAKLAKVLDLPKAGAVELSIKLMASHHGIPPTTPAEVAAFRAACRERSEARELSLTDRVREAFG